MRRAWPLRQTRTRRANESTLPARGASPSDRAPRCTRRARSPREPLGSLRVGALRSQNGLLEHHYWPYLNGSRPHRRNARRQLNCLIQILGVDQVVASKLFLRFREGSVGRGNFPLADAHCRGCLCRLQPVAGDILAALFDPLGEGHVLAVDSAGLLFGHGHPFFLVVVNQANILHHVLLKIGVKTPAPNSRCEPAKATSWTEFGYAQAIDLSSSLVMASAQHARCINPTEQRPSHARHLGLRIPVAPELTGARRPP